LTDFDVVGPPARSLLAFLFALFLELVSACCALEEASLSSETCHPTHMNAMISRSRCFSDMLWPISSARFFSVDLNLHFVEQCFLSVENLLSE
jgi:hypothetical protein